MSKKGAWQKSPGYKKRIEATRSGKIFYIFCEGEKTEPNYFNSFKLSKAKVITFGEGRNTRDLVNWVQREVESDEYLKDNKKQLDEEKDEVWCVFDRDSFDPSDFDNAIFKAEKLGYKLAYSNEAFELWYILHFEFLNTELNRKQYEVKLNKIFQDKFSHKYSKNAEDTYDELLPYQESAIKFAKKLLVEIDNGCPHKNKPTTTVHELVEKLNEYVK